MKFLLRRINKYLLDENDYKLYLILIRIQNAHFIEDKCFYGKMAEKNELFSLF